MAISDIDVVITIFAIFITYSSLIMSKLINVDKSVLTSGSILVYLLNIHILILSF